MTSLNDLPDQLLPLEKRLALALEFAIAALNATPSFGTYILDPETGRALSSYRLLPKLEAVLREAQAAPEKGMQSNQDRTAAVEKILVLYGMMKGQSGEFADAPVVADLLTDLMHYAGQAGIDFQNCLYVAGLRFARERPDEPGMGYIVK